MDKIWVVLRSEFLRRVQNKWFIISTLLAPLFMIAIAVVPGVLAVVAQESNVRRVAVVDQTAVLGAPLVGVADDQFRFEMARGPIDSVRAGVERGDYDAYLLLPAGIERGQGSPAYYSAEGTGLTTGMRISEVVDRVVEQYRLEAEQAPPAVLEILKTNVSVRMVRLTEEGETADSALAFSVIGYIMGFFMYMAMFIYGSFVMQGTIEEKQSRVVEVMISSVKPFQLLMGKVLGIGAMGLLQMAAWAILILTGFTFAGSIFSMLVDPTTLNLPQTATQQEMMQAANLSIPALSPMIFVWFILFFLGGYLLYASLFAAIGSAVEQPQDAQSLMFPVSMLIIVPIIFMGFLIENPNSTASHILSMIPFFSPILMVVRVTVTDVPFLEVALSFLLLVVAFIGSVWVSSRIYRVGVLMYGKKPTIKDLVRWFRYA